jgi:hypothetical protein
MRMDADRRGAIRMRAGVTLMPVPESVRGVSATGFDPTLAIRTVAGRPEWITSSRGSATVCVTRAAGSSGSPPPASGSEPRGAAVPTSAAAVSAGESDGRSARSAAATPATRAAAIAVPHAAPACVFAPPPIARSGFGLSP